MDANILALVGWSLLSKEDREKLKRYIEVCTLEDKEEDVSMSGGHDGSSKLIDVELAS